MTAAATGRTLARLAVAGALGTGVLAGCGDDTEDPATTVASVKTVTATTPATATVTVATPAGSGTRTVEGEVEQTATVSPVVTFAGQRAQSLGDIEVQDAAVLRWACPQTCERFEVTSDEGDDPRLDVSDSGASGTAKVKRGSYASVRVRADSAWTLSLETETETE